MSVFLSDLCLSFCLYLCVSPLSPPLAIAPQLCPPPTLSFPTLCFCMCVSFSLSPPVCECMFSFLCHYLFFSYSISLSPFPLSIPPLPICLSSFSLPLFCVELTIFKLFFTFLLTKTKPILSHTLQTYYSLENHYCDLTNTRVIF